MSGGLVEGRRMRKFMLEPKFSKAESLGISVAVACIWIEDSILVGILKGLGALVVMAMLVEGYRIWDKRDDR